MADTSGIAKRLGGIRGRHASGPWILPSTCAFLLAMASWLICMLRQLPCWATGGKQFSMMCYTDITALYQTRGQAAGAIPYISTQWEYPVLSGYFATAANWLADLFGADFSSTDPAAVWTNTHIYYGINAVLLFACLMWLVKSMLDVMPDKPWLAMIVACSPAIMTTGLINWDMFVVAITAAGLAAWIRQKPVWAGLWFGLGVAAKLYPVVILGALFVWCLRSKRMRAWFTTMGVAIVAWLIVNIPMAMSHPEGWSYFYTFNSDRGADLGSIWYALTLMGIGSSHAITWSRALMVLGYLGLAALIWFAPKRPTVPQIAYLAVSIMVIGNLVYSPQYVLWILPLIVLARPFAIDQVVFALSELVYYCAIWMYLSGALIPASGSPWAYVLSILIRVGASLWLMGRVVRDIVRGNQWPDALRNEHAPAKDTTTGSSPSAGSTAIDLRAPGGSFIHIARGDSLDPKVHLSQSEPLLGSQTGVSLAVAPKSPSEHPRADTGHPPRHSPGLPIFQAAQSGRIAVQGWLASRLLLLLVGLLVMNSLGQTASQVFTHWDVLHYIEIAESGYEQLTQTAFFPGLPLVMALFHLIGIPPVVSGMVLALVSSAFAALALYRLAGSGVAGTIAVLVWSFAPMAVFGFVAYTEAPFCALAFWAWWFARKERWGIAASLAGLACVFRVSGLFLIGALSVLALIGFAHSSWAKRLRRMAWMGIPTVILAAYVVYLRIAFGSWTVWFEAQSEGWGRSFHWPWEAWVTTWRVVLPSSGYGDQATMFVWEIAAIVVGAIGTVLLLWRKKIPEASWVGVQVLAFSFQVWFISVARSVLLWFPLFTSVGKLAGVNMIGWKRRTVQIGLGLCFCAEVITMVWWALRFYSGAWAG